MALVSMRSKGQLLTTTRDLRLREPVFSNTINDVALTTSTVTIFFGDPENPDRTETFTSEPIYSHHIAQDKVCKMALRCIRNYFREDPQITAYLEEHVFKDTRRAWQTALRAESDLCTQVIAHNSKLHAIISQQSIRWHNQTANFHILPDLNKRSSELMLKIAEDEIAKLKCEIASKNKHISYLQHFLKIRPTKPLPQPTTSTDQTPTADTTNIIDFTDLNREIIALLEAADEPTQANFPA